MIGIYKIENLINGKKYIGQSINISERWSEHRQINNGLIKPKAQSYPLYLAFKKYGIDNFSFEVIEECEEDQLDEKEQYWIQKYNSYYNAPNANGYNLTLGGGGWRKITMDDVQQMIKLWEEGKSVGEIAKILPFENHSIIRYLKAYCSSYSIEEGNRRGSILMGKKHTRPVKQYNLNGEFIREYNSITEASNELSIPAECIISNAKFQTKACKDLYYFIYSNEDQITGLEKHMKKKRYKQQRPVVQKDLSGNIINTFSSIKEASRFINGCSTSIGNCCRGKQASYKDYKWEYLD